MSVNMNKISDGAGIEQVIMDDEPRFELGGVVRHADGGGNGTIVRFQAYPMATVRWESTGRESSVNLYYLVKSN